MEKIGVSTPEEDNEELTPGIYTIVCWIKRKESAKAFPATEVCIRAD